MIKFPEGFLWGSSTSGPQSEGRVDGDGKGDSIWDYWHNIEPYKFREEVGPEKTSTFYENYVSDIELLKATGHSVFRTSIQWSRLLPQGTGDINPEAVLFYRDVFKRIKAQGIQLMVNLYHFDMPMTLQELGGWESLEVVEAYEAYARTCFELFDEFVDVWMTFNEPIVHVECGYLNQHHYPMKVDAKAAVQVAYYTQLASSLAVKAMREVNPDKKIGIILNLTPAYPRSDHPGDLKAAENADLLQIRSFLDPSVKGEYPERLVEILDEVDLLPVVREEELAIIRENTVDILGVNYYQPLRVKAPQYAWNPASPILQDYFFEAFDMPGKKMNPHRGWEIYEEGVYDIGVRIKEEYGNIEWILTENGMGVEGEEKFRENGMIQDDYRIEYIKGHLAALHRAIEEGANCKGYMLWTFIDCWSWLNAYKNRYGLVELNLESGERTIKKSGHWYKELSEQNGF